MKAYLRFRVPFHISDVLSSHLNAFYGSFKGFIAKNPKEFHVTIANFGVVNLDRISKLNEITQLAYIHHRSHRPEIELSAFATFKTPKGLLLVALATVRPRKEWDDCREFLFKETGIRSPTNAVWNPHVTLGELDDDRKLPRGLPAPSRWKPDAVEIVYKMNSADLIAPVWRFD